MVPTPNIALPHHGGVLFLALANCHGLAGENFYSRTANDLAGGESIFFEGFDFKE